MLKPEFDAEEYPTEATLKAIKTWPSENNFPGLIEFLREAWRWADTYFIDDEVTLELHTGGYSGNEDIVKALAENVFWHLYWQRSERGGHYYFKGKFSGK